MLELLYYVIWRCIHLCWSAVETIQRIFSRLLLIIFWSYDRCCSGGGGVGVVNKNSSCVQLIGTDEKTYLTQCKSDLTKLPQHLCVVIGPDNLHVNELLLKRLFTYANIMDIDYVSIYDTRLPAKGYIALDAMQVPKEVQFKVIQNNCYQWCESNESSSDVQGKNGYTHVDNGCEVNGNCKRNGDYSIHKKLEVRQITHDDNHALLAKVCRELFKQRHTKFVQDLLQKERSHLTQYISEALQQQHLQTKFPDPELCIIFHADTCTFGVLPWQTRFTEFYTLNTNCWSDFSVRTFAQVLYKYSNCEQRWGK